jgi:hypothetical protein
MEANMPGLVILVWGVEGEHEWGRRSLGRRGLKMILKKEREKAFLP